MCSTDNGSFEEIQLFFDVRAVSAFVVFHFARQDNTSILFQCLVTSHACCMRSCAAVQRGVHLEPCLLGYPVHILLLDIVRVACDTPSQICMCVEAEIIGKNSDGIGFGYSCRKSSMCCPEHICPWIVYAHHTLGCLCVNVWCVRNTTSLEQGLYEYSCRTQFCDVFRYVATNRKREDKFFY